MRHLLQILTIIVMATLISSCGHKGGNSDEVTYTEPGAVKGPFIKGSPIIVYKLNSNGTTSTKKVKGKITDKKGNYSIEKIPWKGISLISVQGKYYNENNGMYNDTIVLQALLDPAIGKTNINVLTHMIADRARVLMKAGKDSYKAKTQAEREVMGFFEINANSAALNPIDDAGKYAAYNAELMRISAAISSNPTLLKDLTRAFHNDGKILSSDSEEKKTLLALNHAMKNVNFKKCIKYLASDGITSGNENWAPFHKLEELNYMQKYSVGGHYSNLRGTLIIKNSDGEQLTLRGRSNAPASGNYKFNHKFIVGTNYKISVIQRPYAQDCDIVNNSGKIDDANVNNIDIICRPQAHLIGGQTYGLDGNVTLTLKVKDNDLQTKTLENITISENGFFTFSSHKELIVGSEVHVNVISQPAGQTCSISNNPLYILQDKQKEEYSDYFLVNCSNNKYKIKGSATGIRLNKLQISLKRHNKYGSAQFSADVLPNQANFTLLQNAIMNSDYNLTIFDTSNANWRSCVLNKDHVHIALSDVNDLLVSCTEKNFLLNANVKGLPEEASNEETLELKLTDDNVTLDINRSGTFPFAKNFRYNDYYNVIIDKQPTHYFCQRKETLYGNMPPSDHTLRFSCWAKKYPLNVYIDENSSSIARDIIGTGDKPPLNVKYNNTLRNLNDYASPVKLGDVVYGTNYTVTLESVPYWATCSLANETGIGSEENNVSITCQRITIHPQLTVQGLHSTTNELNVTLSAKKGAHGVEDINQTLSLLSSGDYTFNANMSYGQNYTASFSAAPSLKCRFTSHTYTNSGLISGMMFNDPLHLRVDCAYNKFTVSYHTLLNKVPKSTYTIKNLVDDYELTTDGVNDVVFKQDLSYGYEYNLTITKQPAGQICSLENSVGIVTQDINDISISCEDINYSVGGHVSGLREHAAVTLGIQARKDASDSHGHIEILKIDEDGQYSFQKDGNISIGSDVIVLLLAKPTGQTCTISYPYSVENSGAVIVDENGTVYQTVIPRYWSIKNFPAKDVLNLDVNCTLNKYLVEGKVTQPSIWSYDDPLVISLNNTYESTVSKGGSNYFAFGYNKLSYAEEYNVTITSQPSYVSCQIHNGSGTITGEVHDINISCQPHMFSIGGTVEGLSATHAIDLTLFSHVEQQTLHLDSNGSFLFDTLLPYNAYYHTYIQPNKHYKCTDFEGNMPEHNVSDIAVNCTYTNTPPTANGFYVSVDENSSSTFKPSTYDKENDTISMTIVSQPAHGNVSVNGNSMTYTPTKDYFGDDSFEYKVNDGELDSTPSTINVKVRNMRDRPVAVSKSVSVTKNTTSIIDLDAHDPNGDTLQYDFKQPIHGVIKKITLPNHIHYTPDSNYTGTDSFTFTAYDGTYYSDSATITIEVKDENLTYSVGGNIKGLDGTVVLKNNDTDTLTLSANGTFNFSTKLADSSTYNVTIATQPSTQSCLVSNGSGTVTGVNINDINITCITPSGIAQLGLLDGAEVKIYKLNSDGNKSLLYTDTTLGGDITTAGRFNAHINDLENDVIYLYEVSGGVDIDSDDDGIVDDTPTPNLGTVHLFGKGSDIKTLGSVRVTMASDIVYRKLLCHLRTEPYTITSAAINAAIAKVLGKDINNDGVIDIDDILRFNAVTDASSLTRTYYSKQAEIVAAIHADNRFYYIGGSDYIGKLSFIPKNLTFSADGKLAYAVGGNKLKIVDINDTANMSIIATLDIDGANDVAVSKDGQSLYIASTALGLQIVNVSDPQHPVISDNNSLGFTQLNGVTTSHNGAILYVEDSSSKDLSIIDINTSSLSIASTIHLSDAGGYYRNMVCSKDDTRLFIATNTLYDINVSDKEHPAILASKTYGNNDLHTVLLSSDESVAYIARYNSIDILDITDADNGNILPRPSSIANFGSGWPPMIALHNDKLYVIYTGAGLYVYDINNPLKPLKTDVSRSEGFNYGPVEIVPDGSTLFAADFRAYNIADSANPLMNRYPANIAKITLSKDNTKAFVIGNGKYYIYDTTTDNNISTISTTSLPSAYSGAIVLNDDETRAYVPNTNAGVLVYNVTDTTAPALISSLDTNGSAQALVLNAARTRLYVADGIQGLKIIDITNEANMTIVGSIDTKGTAYDVVLSHDEKTIFLAARESGLHVIDISNEQAPKLLTTYNSKKTFYAKDLKLSSDGSKLFVGNFEILDVTTASSPLSLAEIDTGDTYQIVLSDDESHAYLADGGDGTGNVKIIDVSNVNNVHIIGRMIKYSYAHAAQGIALSKDGKKVYVADGQAGLFIINVCDTIPSQNSN